ncbi:MAG: acyltransferase family protein, partial [Bacteroidota bacterium]
MDIKTNESRVFGLDLFRAIAIICVVLVHGGFLIEKALPGFPYFSVPDGVELFFVLSGFLIGGILIRLVEKGQLRTSSDLFGFWKRRWFRTLPAYYLVLLLNVIFAWMGWNNSKLESFDWRFLFFMHNFTTPFTDFFWESWSLSIEEWFYIITPLLFLLTLKIFRGHRNQKWTMLTSILILLIAPLIYRISIADQNLDPFWFEVTFRKTVVARLDAIMYGVLFAWLMHYHR